MTISEIRKEVENGNFAVAFQNQIFLNEVVMDILSKPNSEVNVCDIVDIITIENYLYNNSNIDVLPIEDGVYDLIVEKLKSIDYSLFKPGAKPTTVNVMKREVPDNVETVTQPVVTIMNNDELLKYKDTLYPEIYNNNIPFMLESNMESPVIYTEPPSYLSKRLKDTSHNYPNLVGTLDKCKFVLNKQASDAGAFNDSNVKILERDFFAPLICDGVINTSMPIEVVTSIKYDGISIEADVNTEVISARSRGDTNLNEASDLTPILQGYKFPNAVKLDRPIGMKFEAIILYDDLQRMNNLYGTSYVNGRTAIIGILGSSRATQFKEFITLVPLQADFGPDVEPPNRLEELEFLNRYYATKEYIRYTVHRDTYVNLLFKIKKFVEEAEFLRQFSLFMYDGVVLEFTDPVIRRILGRKNSINQYAMAIKFNPLKKVTTFTGYTYTVGQNGQITPMIHYLPVEFLGTIHTKSSGASYARFKSLDLSIGDQIEVTYVNDVMPYVTKPDNQFNRENKIKQPSVEFPETCPSCGEPLEKGDASAYCRNMSCRERSIQRMANMMSKLGIKDFSAATFEQLNIFNFHTLMNSSVNDFAKLGPMSSMKLYQAMQALKTNKLPDYRLIGALGFSDIAYKTWRLIFEKITPSELLSFSPNKLLEDLSSIKGIGERTIYTICMELPYFKQDLNYMIAHNMYIESKGSTNSIKYKIRFSGFRDEELKTALNSTGYIDADDNSSVTKDTTILLVPSREAKSTKITKAQQYGIPIIPISEFIANPGLYIPEIAESKTIRL